LINRSSPPLVEGNWPKSGKVWERVHIDFLGPFMNKMFLLVIDSFSKWPEVYIMNNITSSSTITKLRECFARYGIPECIVSDNGSQLTSETFKIFTKMNNIKHIFTPPYHPKSNGLAENGVRNFKNGLNKILNENTTDLETAMARYLLAYRTAPHATTKTSPAEIMFGRKLRIRLDNVKPPTVITPAINNPNKPSSSEFAIGDTVMVRDYTNPHKPSWRQGEVKQRIGRHVYTVNTNTTNADNSTTWKRHVEQIQRIRKPYRRLEDITHSTAAEEPAAIGSANASPKSPPQPRRSTRVPQTPVRLRDYDCS
jgi:transposase InsO family protein